MPSTTIGMRQRGAERHHKQCSERSGHPCSSCHAGQPSPRLAAHRSTLARKEINTPPIQASSRGEFNRNRFRFRFEILIWTPKLSGNVYVIHECSVE